MINRFFDQNRDKVWLIVILFIINFLVFRTTIESTLLFALPVVFITAPFHIWVLELALFHATINQIDHYTSVSRFLS
jgi:hypothetical protein